ncbi:tRNA uridine-5-carboxymethylaminomethyl(34) synthesis GTPase MnmE [bacterium]|nr:tRNA uridine-5-carboxymethylaminomethyl(34) synthesis GTPase MnmE [bacterium]
MSQNTIAAIATPPGVGGIAIIRISGPTSVQIAKKLTSVKRFNKNSLTTTSLYSFAEHKKIDKVVLSFFKAPHSFTGEDTIEINCHGSLFITNKILTECLAAGARLATPGEFTKRAFLSGKLDLTQVEAISEMIAAKSDCSAQLALKHLEGNVSREITLLQNSLRQFLAEVEASIDFPEEIDEPSFKKIQQQLTLFKKTIETLLANSHKGLLLKNGINVVLAGSTNVGKSTLLNYFAGEQKAIITDIHGTTRDAIETEVSIKGIAVNLIDTAGIRSSQDKIEKIGIAISKEHIKKADLILYLIDATKGLTKKDNLLLRENKEKNIILVINKIDLNNNLSLKNSVKISVKTGQGIKALENKILSTMDLKNIDFNKHVYISSQRTQAKLATTLKLINDSLVTLKNNQPLDLITIDFQKIIAILGDITGFKASEETISHIFENFCVGK